MQDTLQKRKGFIGFCKVLRELILQDESIVYIEPRTPWKKHLLPKSIVDFYNNLPPHAVHIDWVLPLKELEERHRNTPLDKLIQYQELKTLIKAARHQSPNTAENYFLIGSNPHYVDSGFQFVPFHKEDMTFKGIKSIPYDKIGIVFLHHGDIFDYPISEESHNAMSNVLIINPLLIQCALNINHMPRWMFKLILRSGKNWEKFQNLFTHEAYIGMGLDSEQIIGFLDNLSRNSSRLVAVRKYLCMHHGVSVKYLTKEDVKRIGTEIRSHLPQQQEIRKIVEEGVHSSFPYTEHDKANRALPWYLFDEQHQMVYYPIAERAISTIEEFVEPKPVKSKRTGNTYQGTIRAIIFDNKLIAAMHRFPQYQTNQESFVPLTQRETKTFYERCDEKLEEKITKTLIPAIVEFEKTVSKLNLLDLVLLSRNHVSSLLNA